MLKNYRFLMLLAVAVLMAASGAAVIGAGAPVVTPSEAAAVLSAPTEAPDAAACSDQASANDARSSRSLPGCCSTQCNVDKDCDKICGKGNCACLQQTSCCRRCVY